MTFRRFATKSQTHFHFKNMIFEGVSIKNRCFLDFSILSYLRVKIPLRCFMMSPKSTSPNHSKSHSFAYCGLKLPISIQRADSESTTPRVSESTLVVHTSVWVYTSALIRGHILDRLVQEAFLHQDRPPGLDVRQSRQGCQPIFSTFNYVDKRRRRSFHPQ